MTIPRAVRFAAALAIGLAAGIGMWTQVEPLVPSLEFGVHRIASSPSYELWEIAVTAHAGDAVDEITIEPVSGPVHLAGPASLRDIPSGLTQRFRVQIDGKGNKATVRIEKKGRDSMTRDIGLGGEP